MRPILFSLHLGARALELRSYGILIALGLAIGIALGHREARRRGLDGGRVLDFAFWGTVAGLLGSRLAYVAVNAGDFARACVGDGDPRDAWAWFAGCTRALQLWEGGLVFYGGAAAAIAVAFVFARRERWSAWVLGDVFAPGLAIGHAFGRLGCFAAGCCFGKTTDGALGVSFPRGSVAFEQLGQVGALAPAASFTPPLHPSQLYEEGGETLLFALLLALRPRLRTRPGALVLLYAACYALLRFAVELTRGDFARRYLVELHTPRLAAWLGVPPTDALLLSAGQFTSLLLLLAVGLALRPRLRAWRGAPSPNS
jgi:phosphatidylglycerol:prolipoprotein diacylglycerol transferase